MVGLQTASGQEVSVLGSFPGYVVYCMQRGARLLLLLAGGDKSSQVADVELATQLACNSQE